MRTVRIGELNNQISRYLHAVRRGTRIVVMDRDTPVAEIGPFMPDRNAATDVREDLVRRGLLIPARDHR